MKRYPDTETLTRKQQHYNYRQSRVTIVTKNAFSRSEGRWKCLLKRMHYYEIQYATDVVAACVTLHNICELNNDHHNPEWIHLDESVQDYSTTHVDMSQQSSELATRIHDALKDHLYLQ